MVYLNFLFSDASFFESSTTPKAGFETHTSDVGTVSHRRNWGTSGIVGTLRNIKLVSKEITGGKKITNINVTITGIFLEDKEDTVVLQFPCKGQDGFFEDNIAVGLLRYFPSLEKGQEYLFRPYSFPDKVRKDSKGNPALVKGITVKKVERAESGEISEVEITRLEPSILNKETKEIIVKDIPYVAWMKMGDKNIKVQGDQIKREEYLNKIVEENIPRLTHDAKVDGTLPGFTSQQPIGGGGRIATPPAATPPTPAPTASAPVATPPSTPAPTPTVEDNVEVMETFDAEAFDDDAEF